MNRQSQCSSATSGKLDASWIGKCDLALIAERLGTPVFIYSEQQIINNVTRIHDAAKSCGIDHRVELYVPFFPNSNPHVLRPLQEAGLGLLLQLPSEYKVLREYGFDKFIVSPGHVSDNEIDFWAGKGHPTFLSSMDEVFYWLSNSARDISVRIDSLGSEKPGIKCGQLSELSAVLKAHGRDLECFEVYCGSGRSLDDMTGILEQVFAIFKTHFPDAHSINFAGGHGFIYENWEAAEKHFQWGTYFQVLKRLADQMEIPPHVKFLFEPARDVLADIGTLLLGVKRDIISNPVGNIVVTDGSRMLMPSAQLRSRRHNVVFLDQSMAELGVGNNLGHLSATLRGRTILRNDYILPGEYLVPDGVGAQSYMLILDVGAYCATQHMEFLNVPPAAEVLVDRAGTSYLITSPGGEFDKWRHLLTEKKSLTRADVTVDAPTAGTLRESVSVLT
jgi:diaminopimelate decarboxylase